MRRTLPEDVRFSVAHHLDSELTHRWRMLYLGGNRAHGTFTFPSILIRSTLSKMAHMGSTSQNGAPIASAISSKDRDPSAYEMTSNIVCDCRQEVFLLRAEYRRRRPSCGSQRTIT